MDDMTTLDQARVEGLRSSADQRRNWQRLAEITIAMVNDLAQQIVGLQPGDTSAAVERIKSEAYERARNAVR